MKAVLLLRPNVALFSSDVLPVNCSAYSPNPDALRCRSPCRPLASNVPPRTCECLTQTLCCHGCGSTIGYMIVIPCTRCTSSISATNRATNGHRFVFHSTEVVGVERHYIQDEPGVIPYEPTGVVVGSAEGATNPRDIHVSLPRPHHRANSPNLDSIPPPTLEQANPLIAASLDSSYYPYPRATIRRSTTPSSPSTSQNHDPTLINTTAPQPEQKDLPTSRALKPGDVLFWHHLTRCGEIPGVEDDQRARSRPPIRNGCQDLDGNHVQRKGTNLGRVVFGR
ncbi:hypothetical protein AGABI2DRAFT_221752 [Agaricus bisporus var. bisporus H97]|uniref:hypothetical protein n=1 Tax=Agaricus bisporus var. bisporus (strain H97 / ATCC MYA-4626 / FGSC 10389) TaxID=936046 RepID=UPI00029F7301|nr:hypothetical protein AGABI2DRAFT_221752 [Agaricus bisporus var. bisporus H97]EKV47530.1 hypothetical protein AGABI2DRAFT_221752 [Agaricus bisporus var. bisporus H97]